MSESAENDPRLTHLIATLRAHWAPISEGQGRRADMAFGYTQALDDIAAAIESNFVFPTGQPAARFSWRPFEAEWQQRETPAATKGPAMSETTEALIERVLGEHEADVTSYDAADIHGCGCGWDLPHVSLEDRWAGRNWDNYRAHVAAAIAAALAEMEHTHAWVTRQNVTSRGYQMPPYRVCSCGAAETIKEAQ